MSNEPIYVTRTFLPPRDEYLHWLNKAWDSCQLTNVGPIHQKLEENLRSRFEVPYLRLMANGTLAIQLAIRALGVTGKVITTPYSYVATTSAILWEGCEPVYVDIRPDTLCIDPELIEASITADTTAIIATHVYGIPCDVEAIDAIARKHGLKVIYDAAHAFDVIYKGRSILAWGDASTLSFHATKLFHTVEGGAVILHDKAADERLRLSRGFGHRYDEHFQLGINAKMSEVHAAMGMAVLPHMNAIIASRKAVVERYDAAFKELELQYPRIPEGARHNFGYYPVLMRNGVERERVLKEMADAGIYGRRYFYPSLDRLPYVNSTACSESVAAAERAICLPLYSFMAEADVEQVASSFCEVVLSSRSQLSIGVEKAV